MQSADFPSRPRDGVEALVRKVRDLERQVSELRNNLLKQAGVRVEPSKVAIERDLEVRGGGHLTVRDGGRIRVRSADDAADVAYFGDLYAGDEYAGRGIWAGTPGGGTIFTALTNGDEDKAFRVWDNTGRPVLGMHENTARGLSQPTLSVPMHSAYWQAWASTGETAWADVASGGTRVWHQRMYAWIKATTSDSATAGQLRFVLEHNDTEHVVGGPFPVGFAIAGQTVDTAIPAAIPIGGFTHFRLQARVTSGTGRVHAVPGYVEMQP